MSKKWMGLLPAGLLFTLMTVLPAYAGADNPGTGDHAGIGVVAVVLVVSLVVIIALVVAGIVKKRRS